MVAQGGTTGRSERLDQLLELCQSGLERLWLQTLQQRGYLLPDKAQSPVPDHYVVPDFTYVEAAALVFVDGPHHKQPLQQQLDERKRSALDAAGLNVVVFTDDPRQWDAVFNEYRWLFGEGQGESQQAAAPSGAAIAAKPVAPSKLAEVPVTRKTPEPVKASSNARPAIDRYTLLPLKDNAASN